jgi:hypothetical protein
MRVLTGILFLSFIEIAFGIISVQHGEGQVIVSNHAFEQSETLRFRHVNEVGAIFEVSIQKKPRKEENIDFVMK